MSTTTLSKEDYESFRTFLEDACGIVLGDNKHYLVTSRLNRLAEELKFSSLKDMLLSLNKNKDKTMRERIVDAMTTNETSWFRDTYPFVMLQKSILPELVKGRPSSLRIWSAASSTGQESYSISMALSEYQSSHPGALPARTEIVGTDISASVVKMAQTAKYDELSMSRGLSTERKQKFFLDNKDGGWTLKPDVRSRSRFTILNLMNSYALLGRFDIIFCRNVLIYFSSESKKDILERMAQILNPGGYLFLGGSESPTGYTHAYEMVRMPEGVVYRLRDDK